MATQKEILARRVKISSALAKSVTSPKQIAQTLEIEEDTVKNDLRWMQKASRKWLVGWALDGYIFATKNTIDQLEDIETELQKMRQDERNPETKLKIIRELRETINTRWVIQGEGPTRMAMRLPKEDNDGR